MATWFQGSADEFIAVSRKAFEAGISILHFLGGVSIDLRGRRAIAQTKTTINQRALVDGVECDVVCTGRFYDFMEKRNGRWGLVFVNLSTKGIGSIRLIRRNSRFGSRPAGELPDRVPSISPICRKGSASA